MPEKVNLKEKLSGFDELWSPKVVAELNGQYVKVVKCLGKYVWHHHENEDEMFLVIDGELELHFRDKVIELSPGELCVIPKGVEHKPVAKELCQIALFEPSATRNTGNVDHKYTLEADELERI